MSEKLNELKNVDDYIRPKWLDTLTEKEQYDIYCRAKASLARRRQYMDTTELEQAIYEYERMHGLK